MKPIFVQQRDHTDCGIACLISVIRMYGGEATFEALREQSGTSILGTSLLGLQQTAEKQNFSTEVFEVFDIEAFKTEATFPCILHVVMEDKLEHYVVCYSINPESEYTIINPSSGVEVWTEIQVLNRWRTRAVMFLKPNTSFEKITQSKIRKFIWIKELLKEDTPLFVIALFIGVLLSILGLGTAIFSQKLVDEILPKEQIYKLWAGLGLFCMLLLLNNVLDYLRTFFLLRQSKDFNNRIMGDFYIKLLHLPKIFFDSRKTGEIIARLNDTRRIQSVISYLLSNFVIDLLLLIASSVFVFSYSIKIGFFALISIPLFGFLIWRYNNSILLNQRAVMVKYADSESHFVDIISGIGAVKAANKEDFFGQMGKKVYSVFQEQVYLLGTLGNRYGFISGILNTFLIVGVFGLASHIVIKKQLSLGEMMAIFSVVTGMLGAVSRLATTNIRIQEAKVAFERLYEFTNVRPVQNTRIQKKIDFISSLSVRNLSFGFPGKASLLKNIDLEINKGETVVILGEVGSGKSVLIQIIQKFLPYENGIITINRDTNFDEISEIEWRSRIGVVPQEIKLFSASLLDNIVVGNTIEEAEKAIAFCKSFGFDEYFANFSQGYLTIVGDEGVKLSGGQRQLVGLARALYRNPEILILDEPTSAMDSKTELFVLNLLERIKKEYVLIIVTHQKNLISIANRTYLLRNGIMHDGGDLLDVNLEGTMIAK
jgi:ABC-type bacteriocin/lantibiotic exporter with double-glycine peptidase domain